MKVRAALCCLVAFGLLTAPGFAQSGENDMNARDLAGGDTLLVDPVARYNEGMAAFNVKNYIAAREAFRDVLSFRRNDANSNFMMGRTLVETGKIKDSRAYFERAVRVHAEFANARGWLGYVYVKTGDAAKAAEQKTALVALQAKCAGACKESADIEAAIKRIADAAA